MVKVTYAAPAWWGFTNATDRNHLEAVPLSIKHGYCADTTPTLSSLCDKAEQTLFDNTLTNSTHPLHILLPPKVEKHYSTRPRDHCYQLPRKTSVLDENNNISFIGYYIVIFYRLSLLTDISISVVVTAVCLFLLKY